LGENIQKSKYVYCFNEYTFEGIIVRRFEDRMFEFLKLFLNILLINLPVKIMKCSQATDVAISGNSYNQTNYLDTKATNVAKYE